MIKRLSDFSNRKYRAFVGDSTELIIFEYSHNEPAIFFNDKKAFPYPHFVELDGSGAGSTSGYHQAYRAKLIKELTGKNEDDEYTIFVEADKGIGMIKDKSDISFKFLKETRLDLSDLTYIPIPHIVEMESVFSLKTDSGTNFIVLSRPKHRFSYNDYKLHIGLPALMQESKISSFERYRDGGTTVVESEAGKLYIPAPFRKEQSPTWNDVPLEHVDPSNMFDHQTLKALSSNMKVSLSNWMIKEMKDSEIK